MSGARKGTTVCKMKKAAAAKDCVKGLKSATKSKSLLSKSKANTMVPTGKKVKGKLGMAASAKKAVQKKKVSITSKTAAKICNSKLKPKPITSETAGNESAILVEETQRFLKSKETTSRDLTPDLDDPTVKLCMTGGNIRDESVSLECTDAENQPQSGDSRLNPKPVTLETHKPALIVEETGGETLAMTGNIKEDGVPVERTDTDNQPQSGQNEGMPVVGTSVMLKEMGKDNKSTTVDCNSEPETVKYVKTEDAEPMQLGEMESTHLQEVGSGTFLKEQKSLDVSAEEPSKKLAAPPLEKPHLGNPIKASQHVEQALRERAQSMAGTPEIKAKASRVQQTDSGVRTQQEGMFGTAW